MTHFEPTTIGLTIKIEEQRKAAEKAAKEAAERGRVTALVTRVNDIRHRALAVVGKPTAAIQRAIDDLTALDIGEDFAECVEDARIAKLETIGRMGEALAARKAQDDEAARVAAERAELAKQCAEQEAAAATERANAEAKLAAERAELEKQRAAQRAEDDRRRAVEAEKLAAERAALASERAAYDAEVAQQRAKQEAAAREIAGKQAAERAAMQRSRPSRRKSTGNGGRRR